jgi:mannose-6-phosphate isomerase-like protein (cupin superfamily)
MSNIINDEVGYIKTPTRIPVPGDKLIEEFIGRVTTNSDGISVAHMIAPAHWGEEPQCPEFDEVTIMVRGKMQVETQSMVYTLSAGEVFLSKRGITVRYSNPFDEENEYWAICTPAFSIDMAGR